MAVYPKLLLSSGGGIISSQQQADQAPDTATVLIGLGGTGVHCIRTIKTQVYTRLKPDVEKAVIPAYDHIRFIGVDTTDKSQGGALTESKTEDIKKADAMLPLDDTEFFSIANNHLAEAIENKLALKQRLEMSWLEHEKIGVPNMTDAGAGGIRQVGRFMMMDKSQDFMAKVDQEISAAKLNLNNPRINVHVFAGLSGGTGSGCFLDVCYMIRSIAKRIGGVTLFGYFFLPDVNLSIIPHEAGDARKYIPQNGYASMQELDYCMGIENNGGSFEQVYQGHKTIKWDAPPVDMCHLICATDKDNNVIPDAYNYAMNVTAEYIMDFLTKSSTVEYGLSENLSNFVMRTNQANSKKTIGSDMAYCVIGASCASIPLREINTYLASELFDKFGAIKKNMPNKADVERLAVASLAQGAQNDSDIYESLYRELRDGAMGEYGQYQDDWKFVLQYGNSGLMQHYTNQTSEQLNKAETNAKSMTSSDNKKSLLGRLQAQLADILRDIKRGPIYAYRMLAASESHNLLNIIDGLIAENTSRWNQEAAQTTLRVRDYEDAKSNFEIRRNRKGRWADNDKKRFNDYEYYLMLAEQHKLTMQVYDKLNTVLLEFKKQVIDVTAAYYIKLNRVMDTLINTFAENKSALANQRTLQANGSFATPMMTISEMKTSLDKEIDKIDVPNMLGSFMELLLNNKEDWITEDGNKISRLVIKFFVETAFNDFANKTITSFLMDKYENKLGGKVTNAQLTDYIYNDWMKLLTGKASPLFHFKRSIWPERNASKFAFLSFPSISAPIKDAAEQMHKTSQLWGLKHSALTDRIFIMCSANGLPLSSYNNCTEYEHMFFSAKSVGRHLYEGKPNPSIDFTDWNKLPSITPQSLVDVTDVPDDLAKLITEARTLYAKAHQYGVIDEYGYICEPDEKAIMVMKDACDSCADKLASTSRPQDIPSLDEAVKKLKKDETITMTRTAFSFPTDGNRNEDFILSIQQDHFVSAPAVHKKVASIIEKIETARSKTTDIIVSAERKIAEIRENSSAIDDYCDAIFTGVISIEGHAVEYRQNTFGIVTDIMLSKKDEGFVFGKIPVYQGFVSYQKLPAETRIEIKKMADERVNANAPELISTGESLKKVFSGERLNVWNQLAADIEQGIDIKTFLIELSRRFDTYCKEHGI